MHEVEQGKSNLQNSARPDEQGSLEMCARNAEPPSQFINFADGFKKSVKSGLKQQEDEEKAEHDEKMQEARRLVGS